MASVKLFELLLVVMVVLPSFAAQAMVKGMPGAATSDYMPDSATSIIALPSNASSAAIETLNKTFGIFPEVSEVPPTCKRLCSAGSYSALADPCDDFENSTGSVDPHTGSADSADEGSKPSLKPKKVRGSKPQQFKAKAKGMPVAATSDVVPQALEPSALSECKMACSLGNCSALAENSTRKMDVLTSSAANAAEDREFVMG
mmetsp:Transcript_78390/g.196856  ORF Transcript_78390/g.196856 Transcript_78390/m.196856 type:complete len:202 (+) Transcript_78390:102-707(+)